jgi:hypothetical protein
MGWRPAWVDTGLIFTRENGQVLHPEHVTKRFARLVHRECRRHPDLRQP